MLTLTLEEKKIVQRLVKHGIELVENDEVVLPKNKKKAKERRENLLRTLNTINNKIVKDINILEKKNEGGK